MLKNYLNSSDIKLNLYGVYIIKNFLEKYQYDDYSIKMITDQLNDEYLLLLTSLLNKNNKKLSFNILIILVNVSFTDEGELLFGHEEKVISNIASFMGNNRTDINLLDFGILLIKNITHKNSLVKQIFKNYNLIQFFNEIYDKFLLDTNFMRNLILCIGHFVDSRFGDPNILSSIKIIKTQLKPCIPIESLTQYVYILYNLSFYADPQIIEEMVKNEIHKDFMNIYPFNIDNNIKINQKYEEQKNENNNKIIIEEKEDETSKYKKLSLLILKTLGKMLSLENNNINKTIVDSGIGKFLNKVFQSTDIKIIKNAFFCLSNICAGTYGQISNLYDNDTIFEAFKIAEYVYDTLESSNKFINSLITEDFIKAFREINYSIALIIINSLYERLMSYVRNHNYAVIKILLKGLKIFSENNIDNKNKYLIIYILNAISKINDYEKDNDEEELIMSNLIKFPEFLEQNGFKEILGKLLLNPDEDIVDIAENIYDNEYDDHMNNDNVNIDDIVEDEYDDNDNCE